MNYTVATVQLLRVFARPARLSLLLFAGLAGACRGEVVDPAAQTADAAASDAAGDAFSPCNLPGNLVPNGTFVSGLSGWSLNTAKGQEIAGPCGGKGLRVYEITAYGSVTRQVTKKLASGQVLRLRAWFKGLAGSASRTPSFFIRALRRDDAGAETGEFLGSVESEGSADWTMGEVTVTLPYDAFGFDVIIASRTADPDEFAVGGVSVVLE